MPEDRETVVEPNWEEVKAEYVTTKIGYRELADKYGISRRTVFARGKREGWVKEREKHRDAVVARMVRNVQRKEASDGAKRLLQMRSAADGMTEVIAGAIEDVDQFRRHLVTVRDGDRTSTEERLFDKVDTRAVRDLMVAMRDLTAVLRDLYDLPSLVDREAREMALERLELERQKARLATGEGEDDEGGVVILAERDGGTHDEG